MKDSIGLLIAGGIASVVGWGILRFGGELALSAFGFIAFISVLLENRKLRKQLQTYKDASR